FRRAHSPNTALTVPLLPDRRRSWLLVACIALALLHPSAVWAASPAGGYPTFVGVTRVLTMCAAGLAMIHTLVRRKALGSRSRPRPGGRHTGRWRRARVDHRRKPR